MSVDEVERNGIEYRRPIMGGACVNCVWGPLAMWAKEALEPYDYHIQICYNCNRELSVPFVAERRQTQPLDEADRESPHGYLPSPVGVVELGATNSHALLYTYTGERGRYKDDPQSHLRLIAFIEDLHPFQLAARRDLGLEDFHDVVGKNLALNVFAEQGPFMAPILEHYGLSKESVESSGGRYIAGSVGLRRMGLDRGEIDVVLTAHGGLANNTENDLLYELSQKADLTFYEMDADLMSEMAAEFTLEIGTLPRGLIKGMDRAMKALIRNGQSVYSPEGLDETFVYTVAKALDESRGMLKFLNRPFFYDSRAVWKGLGAVPLHPGAERYYREVGYLA